MTERDIIDRLELGQVFAPPFRVTDFDEPAGERIGLDVCIELSYGGVERAFGVEVKSRSVTRAIRDGAAQASKLVARAREEAAIEIYPMVACPYLSPDLARELIANEVSAVDLSGNLVVVIPGTWYVERLGAPNRFPETKLVKNPYRGTSSLVGRVLVVGERFRSAKELTARIIELGGSITEPTVSKVLRQLEDEALVTRDPEIRATDRARLLDLLASNYPTNTSRRRMVGSVPDVNAWKREAAERARATDLRFAAFAPERYADFPSSYEELRVSTNAADRLLAGTEFKEGDRWPNLTVSETEDVTAYFDLRVEDGVPWSPPLEVYLALRNGGKREQETARAIAKRILGVPSVEGEPA